MKTLPLILALFLSVSPLIAQQPPVTRKVPVTNLGDAGPGSLRAAIEYANDVCARDGIPCDIEFAVGGFIYPNTPLPPITASFVTILGSGVSLKGTGIAQGHGLELHGDFIGIHGLTIIAFPWDGIAVAGTRGGTINRSVIFGNGSRGISFNSRGTETPSEYLVIDNAITENRRSGIFIEAAAAVAIKHNYILQNGASGIYAGPRSQSLEVHRNTITRNAHFGVAVAREVSSYRLFENAIFANGVLGIDRGLDGFSGYEFDDSDPRNAKIPPPRLVSASVDPGGLTTTITGTYHDGQDQFGSFDITLYKRNGEIALGHTTAANGVFTFTVLQPLSGEVITATGQRERSPYSWTSEFAEPMVVP